MASRGLEQIDRVYIYATGERQRKIAQEGSRIGGAEQDVPAELATGLIQALTAAQSLIPDPQVKDLLAQLVAFSKSVTDGKPNDYSPSPGVAPKVGAENQVG